MCVCVVCVKVILTAVNYAPKPIERTSRQEQLSVRVHRKMAGPAKRAKTKERDGGKRVHFKT